MNLKYYKLVKLLILSAILLCSNSCKKTEPKIKVDPNVTWVAPQEIIYGTPLSREQLNANSDVPGKFIYTPPIGTILNSGINQILKVDFTPTDDANYNIASKTININVVNVGRVIFNPNLSYGSMTDQDANTYKTITIGTQTWMAENLRTTKYRNGDVIDNVINNATWAGLNTGAYCSYRNTTNLDSIRTYGRLYNWYAANNQYIAPLGWHLPTNDEWIKMMFKIASISESGRKMKETGITHWANSNSNVTNESGFTSLPSGCRQFSDGIFVNLGSICIYWSSTVVDNYVWGKYIRAESIELNDCLSEKRDGLAIRLVKD